MSRYQLIVRQQNGRTAYILKDHLRRAEAVLYPELGNNCLEFRTTPDGTTDDTPPSEIFVPTDDLEALIDSPFHAGQPILFPFPNRVREGKFTFEGQAYNMAGLLAKGWDRGAGQAIHGLVGDKAWEVEYATADENGVSVRATIATDAHSDIIEQYPFPCTLSVTYTLKEGILEMLTEVHNRGEKTLPMGFGIHPWFPVRIRPGVRLPAGLAGVSTEERGTTEVKIPADSIWVLEKLMPTGETRSVIEDDGFFDLREFRALEQGFYDNVFTHTRRREDGWSEAGVRDPESGLEIYIAADAEYREWVLYAPVERRVVAIEPYTCVTDAVNLQAQGIDAGLIALPAGEIWSGTICFGLRPSVA